MSVTSSPKSSHRIRAKDVGCFLLLTAPCLVPALAVVLASGWLFLGETYNDLDHGECEAAIEQLASVQRDSTPTQVLHYAIDPAAYPIITSANAPQITELEQIGRGYVLTTFWSENGDLNVLTSAGLYRHSAGRLDSPPQHLWSYDKIILEVAVSGNGQLIAPYIRDDDSFLSLWSAETGETVVRLHTSDRPGSIEAVVFNNDGSRIAANYDNHAYVWDDLSTDPVAVFDPEGWIDAIVLSSDGQLLAIAKTSTITGTAQRRTQIQLINIDRREQIAEFNLSNQLVNQALRFSPDGMFLAGNTFSTGGFLQSHLWQSRDGRELQSWRLRTAYQTFDHLGFSPDSSRLSVSNAIFQLNMDTPLKLFPDGSVTVFSPDGEHILSLPNDRRQNNDFAIWDAAPPFSRTADLDEYYSWQQRSELAFDPNGNLLGNLVGVYLPDPHLLVSPDESKFVLFEDTGSSDGGYRLRLCDRGTGRQLAVILSNTPVKFSPDSTLLAVNFFCSLEFFSTTSGESVGKLPYCDNPKTVGRSVTAFSWNSDQSMMALGVWDYWDDENHIELWDARTFQRLGLFHGTAYRIAAIAIHPDDTFIATTGGDGTVRLWGVRGE